MNEPWGMLSGRRTGLRRPLLGHCRHVKRAFVSVSPNTSIERTFSGRLRLLPAAAHVER